MGALGGDWLSLARSAESELAMGWKWEQQQQLAGGEETTEMAVDGERWRKRHLGLCIAGKAEKIGCKVTSGPLATDQKRTFQ